MMEVYQDVWARGQRAFAGVRECASRYDAMRPVFDQFRRPFTVLDLGAHLGYFSFRLAEDYPGAVCVAVDDDPRLWDLCEANAPIIHLQQRLTVDQLRTLGTCEHFDVVLALNVLHHMDEAALEAVMDLGDRVIVETPHPWETMAHNGPQVEALYCDLVAHKPKLLTTTPSHLCNLRRPMFLFETPKDTITRPYWDAPEGIWPGMLGITSSFDEKRLFILRKREDRPWMAGINLRTYERLSGIYPPRRQVADWIRATPVEGHGDVRPWNFILDPRGVHLIDAGDTERAMDTDDHASLLAVAAEFGS